MIGSSLRKIEIKRLYRCALCIFDGGDQPASKAETRTIEKLGSHWILMTLMLVALVLGRVLRTLVLIVTINDNHYS
jgi:hypothetical protein